MSYHIVIQLIETDSSGLVAHSRIAVKDFNFGDEKQKATKAFYEANVKIQTEGGKEHKHKGDYAA